MLRKTYGGPSIISRNLNDSFDFINPTHFTQRMAPNPCISNNRQSNLNGRKRTDVFKEGFF